MSRIKQLAGQTVIYGASNILGRLFNYLLVPLYTRVFIPSEFGSITEFYAYIPFFFVFLTFGMETAFFRYSEKEADKDKVYTTSLIPLLFTSAFFVLIVSIFSKYIADLIRYPGHVDYIIWCTIIVALDAVVAIPFAKLRAQNKAFRFAGIKLIFIASNVFLNIFFILLCPYIYKHHTPLLYNIVNLFFDGHAGVGYVFLSNLLSNILILILLLPELLNVKYKFDNALFRRMFRYALPLIIVGFSGIINETLDRAMLKYLLPKDVAMTQLGIYGACYKISILITLFIQAFRYTAEPFFFAYEKESDSRKIYADVMKYFVIVVSSIFLVIMLYIDLVMLFVGPKFRIGEPVVPILLLANLCLGITYNLSIWYKLTNRTGFGALVSIAGALITIVLNIYWIPIFGYMGSAWATFICYASMMIISYIFGQKYYYIHYDLKRIFLYIGMSLVLFFVSNLFHLENQVYSFIFNTFLFFIFVAVILFSEKPKIIFKTKPLS